MSVPPAPRTKRHNTAVIVPQLPEGIAIHSHPSEKMIELADGSVSLVVTSLPYWIAPIDSKVQPAIIREDSSASSTHSPVSYDEHLDLLDRCFIAMWRVLKPGGLACVNVASPLVKGTLYPLPFDLLVRLRDAGWEVKEEFVWRRWHRWNRRAASFLKQPYPGYFFPNRVHEYIFVLKKPGPPIYIGKHDDQKWASALLDAVLATRAGESAEKEFYTREFANTIWNVLPGGSNGSHQRQFPEELAYRLISLYSYRGDLVLDPFCGSGTTAKIAHRLGRKFVGYETNSAFVSVAKQRVLDGSPVKREQRVARFAAVPESQNLRDKTDGFCYGCGNKGEGITRNRPHP